MYKGGRVLRILFAVMYFALLVFAVVAQAWWAVLVLVPLVVLRVAQLVLLGRRRM